MKERSFFDSNILIYTDDSSSPGKQTQALALLKQNWENGTGILSTQVLQEYFSAVTRKQGIPPETAQRKIVLLSNRLKVFSITHHDIVLAIDIHRLHSFSFWDSLIVRMAQKSASSILYSEDMQHGQVINDLKIINPFL